LALSSNERRAWGKSKVQSPASKVGTTAKQKLGKQKAEMGKGQTLKR